MTGRARASGRGRVEPRTDRGRVPPLWKWMSGAAGALIALVIVLVSMWAARTLQLTTLSMPTLPAPPPTLTGDGTATALFDVFLSHAGTEKRGVVSHLHRELVSRGIRVFVDYEMTPSTNATRAMLSAAYTARVGVVVLSREFFRREWPLLELRIFLERMRATPTPTIAIVPYFYTVAPWEDAAVPVEHGDLLRAVSEISGRVQTLDTFEADSVISLADEIERLLPPGSRRRTAEQVKLDTLLSTGITVLENTVKLPSYIVHASHAIVPFEGRDAELAELFVWATSKDRIRALVIHGDGGVGKTRLLQELCAQLRGIGQRAGFARTPLSPEAMRSLVLSDEPTTVVLDYANTRSDMLELLRQVTDLMDANSKRDGTFRVVLVARTAGAWLTALKAHSHQAELLLGASDPILIGALALSVLARQEQFQRALAAFAKFLDMPVPELHLPLEDARYNRILYIHLAALAALHGELIPADKLLETTLVHEERAWRQLLPASNPAKQDASMKARRATVAATTLRGGLPTREEAERMIHRLGLVRSENVDDLVTALSWLYPGRHTEPGRAIDFAAALEPDLLGEELVWRVLRGYSDHAAEVLRSLFPKDDTETALRAAFGLFARMSSGRSGVEPWIAAVLDVDVNVRGILAFTAVLALAEDEHLDTRMQGVHTRLGQALAQSLRKHGTVDQARYIKSACPHHSVSLLEVKAWAGGMLVAAAIESDGPGSAAHVNALLFHISAESSLGNREIASELAAEAVPFARTLLTAAPNKVELIVLLNRALSTMSGSLVNLGRTQHAMEIQHEALALSKRLQDFCEGGFLSMAARDTHSLGVIQAELGMHSAAISSKTKAVEAFRDLARTRPGEVMKDLADSLINLGLEQNIIGHHHSALASTAEAVAIYRELARTQPDAFMPDLALSLNNLGNTQRALGQMELALESNAEAVQYYVELARIRPHAFMPDLAVSFSSLGEIQSALGYHAAALVSTTKAYYIYRYLVQGEPEVVRGQPEVFAPDLAKTSESLGIRFSALGRHTEAFKYAKEATDLARQFPLAFQTNLVRSQHHLCYVLGRASRNAPALLPGAL